MKPNVLTRLLLDPRVCQLSGPELRVLLLLWAWGTPQSRVQLSATQIAGLTAHSVGTVRRALKSLVGWNLIAVYALYAPNGARKANHYEVRPPRPIAPVEATP